MNFKHVRNFIINKTGATCYFDLVFKTVRGKLIYLSLDPVNCLDRSFQVMKGVEIHSFANSQSGKLDTCNFNSYGNNADQSGKFYYFGV